MMKDILARLIDGVIEGPEDSTGMGECLNLLDQLEGCDEYPDRWSSNVEELRRLFHSLILDESKDPDEDWKNIRGLIARLCANGDSQGPSPAIEKGEEIPGDREVPLDDPFKVCVRDSIEESREHLASIELNMLSLEANPEDREAINAVFGSFHSLKGVSGFLNLKDIQHLSREVENLLDAARSGNLTISDAVIDMVLQATDILKVLLNELEKVQNRESAVVSASPVVYKFLERVGSFSETGPEGAGAPIRKVGEILVEKGVLDEPAMADAVERGKTSGRKLGQVLIEEGLASATEVSGALREQRRTRDGAASVRIDTRKLDNLVDMVGELVTAQSMVLQNPDVLSIKDQKLQKDTVQLNRITAELRRAGVAMRMVPIKGTFQGMIRLVRDLARKSGKEVHLLMRGEETEIDRSMVEAIHESLAHMIRNAVDHGIETPGERARLGKDPAGTIQLGAEQKGGNIVIDVRDDGKGLDAAGIRSKGDVVKKNVEALGGKIEIMSTYGKGTHFQVKLPLTMAIVDGMVIRVGEERYVVPTIAVKESLRPARDACGTVQKRGEMIRVRDSLLPLIRLHRVFEIVPRCRDPWDALLLVVTEGGYSYCLLADEIVGRQEVVIKGLGGALRDLMGIAGGAILGDGQVALIIDVKGVVRIYEEKGRRR